MPKGSRSIIGQRMSRSVRVVAANCRVNETPVTSVSQVTDGLPLRVCVYVYACVRVCVCVSV